MADASSLTVDQRKSLMVNYVPRSMSSMELQEMFMPFGPIVKCHLVKNNATGESKGYGFITFSDEESSTKAIAGLNGRQVEDKRLRVAYSTPVDDNIRPKPASSSSVNDEVNVYIANLPKSWKEFDLAQAFSKYGPVKHTKVLSDSNGESRGAGFVRYDNSKMAAAAILDMDGKCPDVGGMPLIVKIAEAKKKTNIMISPMSHPSTNVPGLILNNALNHSMPSQQHNSDHRFNPYAKHNNNMPTPQTPNQYSHPGAYPPVGVNYAPASTTHSPHPSAPAGPPQFANSNPQYPNQGYMPHSVPSNSMMPQGFNSPMAPTNQPAPDNKNHCLYIGNLPDTTCKSCLLYQLFSPFGGIANVKPMSNVKSESANDHWFAFVNMKQYADSCQAIQSLNGSTLNGRVLKVDFKTEKKRQ